MKRTLLTSLFGFALLAPAWGQNPPPTPPAATPPAAAPAASAPDGMPPVGIDPHALDLLKAMSKTLAGASSLSFKAVATYESPARNGQPLWYTTQSDVTLKRPNRLRVITPGDGAASEFYYDGKVMMAYTPEADLVAVADAPPTIDAMLKLAFDKAAIYFPFTDMIVADPYKDLSEGLVSAFVSGQSRIVGGTLTDMVAIANADVQMEIWIGAKDHLPRMARAVFPKQPGMPRYQLDLSDWKLGGAPDVSAPAKVTKAKRIEFARPDADIPKKP